MVRLQRLSNYGNMMIQYIYPALGRERMIFNVACELNAPLDARRGARRTRQRALAQGIVALK